MEISMEYSQLFEMLKEKETEIYSRKKQIDELIEQFHEIFSQKFQETQIILVQELERQALRLKTEIQELKKLTEAQKIEELVMKKRQEKENERMKLQVMWRELNEKYKHMVEEGKKLEDENRQAKQDIMFLQEKVQQIENQNCRLQSRIKQLKDQKETFITQKQNKKPYVSPYKYDQQTPMQSTKKMRTTKKLRDDFSGSSNKFMDQDPLHMLCNFLARPQIRNKIFDIIYP